MGDGCLNNEHFEELGGILKGKLEEHFKNQQLRQGEFLMFVVYLFFNKELNMLLIMYKPPPGQVLFRFTYFVQIQSQIFSQAGFERSFSQSTLLSDMMYIQPK